MITTSVGIQIKFRHLKITNIKKALMMKKAIALILSLHFILIQTNLAFSQASLVPNAVQQFFDNNGKPLSGGSVTHYIPNTSTPATVYQNSTQTTPWPSTIKLNGSGRPPGNLGIYGAGSYSQKVVDQYGNLIWQQPTSTSGSGGGGGGSTIGDGQPVGTIREWSGFSVPTNYVFAYGQSVSRSTYSALYTVITNTQTANCVGGSPTLTGIADTSQLNIGAAIEGGCILAGTTISAIVSSSSITMSQNALVTTNTPITFFPYGNGDGSTTFNIPDLRGRTVAGRDNMGGVAASRLTSAYFGSLAALGATGGSQSYTMRQSDLPNVNQTVVVSITDPGHTHAYLSPQSSPNQTGGGSFPANTGNGQANTTNSSVTGITASGTVRLNGNVAQTQETTIQPTFVMNYIIKVIPDANTSGNFVTSLGGMTGAITCGTGLTCSGSTISSTFSVSSISAGATVVNGGPGVLYNSISGGTLTIAALVDSLVSTTAGIQTSKLSYTAPSPYTGGIAQTQTAYNSQRRSVIDFGAKGDTLGPNQNMYDGAITTGTNAFTSNNASFTSGDINKVIRIQPASTVTITNASPGVFSWANHGLTAGTQVVLTTTGTLPSPLVAGTVYFVIAAGLGTNSFELSLTSGGAAINTSTAGSGTHTARAGILLDTTISAVTNAHAVTLVANAAGTYSGAKFYYGTDDTTAIQAAINAAQSVSSSSPTTALSNCVYVPAVSVGYIITTALSITSTACIKGDIGPYIGAASQFIPGLSINGITANMSGVLKLAAIGVYYPVPATNGTSAISITSGSGSNYFPDIRDVMVWNADTALTNASGSQGTIDNFRSYYARIGAVVQSSFTPDATPIQILNSQFLGWQTTAPASSCVIWNTGGAFRFENNVCAFTTTGLKFSLTSGASTSQALIAHNDFDNGASPSGTGISISRQGATGTYGKIILDGNLCNSVQTCVSVPTDATGAWLTGLTIANNHFTSAASGTFAAIDTATGILIGNNTLISTNSAVVAYNIGATVNDCSIGVNTLSGTFSASTFTSACGATIPGPLTLSSALTYGGVTLTNAVTGAGKMVLSSNPTFTTDVLINATSATSFAVGPNGVSNPSFNVDASTASAVAGLNVKGDVTGGTVALSAIDSGSNTNLTLNAKGTGTLGIGNISTGAVTITPATTIKNALSLGTPSSIAGTIALANATSTGLTTIANANVSASNYTATLPANTGTIAETNINNSFSAAQTISASGATALNVSGGAITVAGDGTSLFYSAAAGGSLYRLSANGATYYGDIGTGGTNTSFLIFRGTSSFTTAMSLTLTTGGGSVAFNSNSAYGTLYVNGNGQFNTTSTTGTGLNVGGISYFAGATYFQTAFGYPTGLSVGGAVTQLTNRTTGVTLNNPTGAITMFSAAGSATAATFTVTNSTVAATDTIHVAQKSGTNLYNFVVTAIAAGSFNITFFTTGGTATDAPVINFAVIKGSTT